MTVYAKKIYNENNQRWELLPAYDGYENITGFASNIELCLEYGFEPYTTEQVSLYNAGILAFNSGGTELIDQRTNPDYIQAQKDTQIENITSEMVDVLTQFDISWSRNVTLGLKTAAQMKTARDAVKAEYTQKISEVENG